MKEQKQASMENSINELSALLVQQTAELALKNRELEIEAALERVRTRSMALHKSEELQEVITVVLEQLQKLEIKADSSYIGIFNEDNQDIDMWIATPDHEYAQKIHLPYFKHPFIDDIFESKDRGDTFLASNYTLEEKNSFFEYAFEYSDFKFSPDHRKKFILEGKSYIRSFAWSKNSGIAIQNFNEIPYTDKENEIIKRLARVFEQAYTRFLDVKKAEEHARKSQIETALERVRSRTNGIHKSEELSEIIFLLNTEILNLGIELTNSHIATDFNFNDPSAGCNIWVAAEGRAYMQKFFLPYIDHPITNKTFEARKKGIRFYTEFYTQEVKNQYFKIFFENSDFKKIPKERKQDVLNAPVLIRAVVILKNSFVIFQRYTETDFTSEENEIFQRFGNVFEHTYTRYLDIMKAESHAREVTKQASLDHVRGEIASMRSKDDLNRITPLVWHELTTLGVPFIRCGVLIMDEKRKIVHTYLSTPDGKSLGVFDLTLDSDNIVIRAIHYWRLGKNYEEHWDKNQFVQFMQSLINSGRIKDKNSYQGAAGPPESLYLNFLPFKQGMLYVGNTTPLLNDERKLVKSLAEAFSIAYARYEDFKQLEEAKNQIELTLNELKSTQSQLIQSVKMASLGELTAGIAHEIQNPLNFVNNFSEINSELIDEMQQEMDKGNLIEAKAISNDIKDNEQKIIHHGKRADAIVKGMLQHSRTSSGQKELIDINKLADEYLRLSYHGLRAKDKSFSADFKTEFDKTLPKINVIPQDIGRVLLNLINNAFYAAPLPPEGGFKDPHYIHKPTVIVKTSYLPPSGGMRGAVFVSVSDNGPGIPASIVDKIFQPFFTTKPTGQGTGLGLSLTYDIVKAHGGELKVKTKEGEGTEFIVNLPNEAET